MGIAWFQCVQLKTGVIIKTEENIEYDENGDVDVIDKDGNSSLCIAACIYSIKSTGGLEPIHTSTYVSFNKKDVVLEWEE